MLSRFSRTSTLTRTALSRNARTMASLQDTLKGKERVEEDRFMRAQDEKWREKLREIRALEATDEEHRIHSEVISPVMQEVSSMLAATGDGNVSETGLERMAKWKLGLK